MMQVPIGGADCRASQIIPSQGARRAKRTDIIHILHLFLKEAHLVMVCSVLTDDS
jgi:hypothetical protein